MNARAGILCLLFTAAALTSSCASMGGVDLRAYPKEERTLFLHNFRNNTFQPDGNVELTEIVRHEIGRRGNFVLSPRKQARYRLYGRLIMYRKEGRMFDNLRNAIRYELTAVCRIRLRDNQGNVEGGEVVARVEYSERQGFLETESRARQRLNRILAMRISNAIEVYFTSTRKPPAARKR